MIAELGQVALLGAVLISILMGVLPMIGAARGNQQLMNVGRTAATAQFLLVGSAFAMLTSTPKMLLPKILFLCSLSMILIMLLPTVVCSLLKAFLLISRVERRKGGK